MQFNQETIERLTSFLLTHPHAFELAEPFLNAELFKAPKVDGVEAPDADLCPAVYRVIAEVWKRVRNVPTERELIAALRKDAESKGALQDNIIVQGMRVHGLYQIDTTEATQLELAEYVASHAMLDYQSRVSSGAMKPLEAASELRKRLEQVEPLAAVMSSESRVKSLFSEEYLQERFARMRDNPPKPITLGFDLLDDALDGGGLPGEQVLILGQAGAGKSAVMMNMAKNMVAAGLRVVVMSFDNIEDRYVKRLYACTTGFEVDDERYDIETLHNGIRNWSSTVTSLPDPLLFRDLQAHTLTIGAVGGMVRNMIRDYGKIDVLMIDYLQQVLANERRSSSTDPVLHYQVAEGARAIGKAHGCLVVNAYQANYMNLEKSRQDPHWCHSEENMGDSKAVLRATQACFGINQSIHERKEEPGLLRINAVKVNHAGRPQSQWPWVADHKTWRFYPDNSGRWQEMFGNTTSADWKTLSNGAGNGSTKKQYNLEDGPRFHKSLGAYEARSSGNAELQFAEFPDHLGG